MPNYTTEDIRNIALVGHIGSGKTSLAEALLKEGGTIPNAGEVEKGTTASDFTDEEKDRGASIYSSIVHCNTKGKHINIIDTPGSADFVGQAIGAIYAVETALIVVNAGHGIEPGTRRMMDRAQKAGVGRMIVINKIDTDNVDLGALVESLKETFGAGCLPLNLPTDGGKGIVECFFNTEGDSDLGSVADAHTAIAEQVIEMDDELMEAYLGGEEVDPKKLHNAFELALREGHLIPICFVAARTHDDAQANVGVHELFDTIVDVLPNPTEANLRNFRRGEDELAGEPDASKPVIAHTFKIFNDRFGKMAIYRVHEGTIKKDSQLYVHGGRKPLKLSHVYSVQGEAHDEVDKIVAGDIGAVIKIDDLEIGSVLSEQAGDDLKLIGEVYPEPMHGLAIKPKNRGDEQKIGDALHKMTSEDPTFKCVRDATTHETVVYGVGEQHVKLVLGKMKKKFGVDVETAPPKIAYRETILGKSEGHHRHKKQSGGAGQFGEVYLRIEPLPEDSPEARSKGGTGLEFSNDIFGGSIPGQYVPAVEKGVRQVLSEGCVAGYPMQDIKVSVYDGKHHPVDSKEVAFVTAAKKAFVEAVAKARPVLLEPVVHLEVTIPNENMGDITGDLSGKRGKVQGTDMLPGGMCVIEAQVPLAEVGNYQSQLKSVTGGQGSYTMELSHYEAVPGNVQQKIVAKYQPRHDED